jgi:hypothetical protein
MHTGNLALSSIALTLIVGLQAGATVQTGRQANDPVSGIYQGTAKMPAGSKDVEFVIELQNDSGTLSGHAEAEGRQFPLTGTYSGGSVTIKFKPGDEFTILAKVSGDRITGTWEMDGGRTGAIEMKRVNPGWKQVHDLIVRAKAEQSQALKAGTGIEEANRTAKIWADQLLGYSRQHPDTEESKDAANEALILLLGPGLIADAAARSAELNPADEIWGRAVMNQLWAAAGAKDYDYAIRNAEALIEHSKRPDLKAQIRLAQGDAYWEKGDTAQAKAVFRRATDEYPKTRFADEARGNIYEIESLNVGQAAPRLESKFVDGHQARLADFKGKTVLLVFWASW